MNERKLVAYTAALSVIFVVIVSGYFYWTRGVYVSVTNNTQDMIKHLDIAYEGGVIQIVALGPKMSYSRYVNPASESDLILQWSDSSGAKHSQTAGVYIEHNYAGSVEIGLEPNNRVSVTDKVRFMPWPAF